MEQKYVMAAIDAALKAGEKILSIIMIRHRTLK